jgi:hypothetical protein
VRGDPAPIRRDEDLGRVGGDIRRRPHRLDEPRRPGPEELDPNDEAVEGIGVDRHVREHHLSPDPPNLVV